MVLIVGSVAYDTVITAVETRRGVLGGAASYAAIAASYFSPVELVAVVGNDFAERDIEVFRKRGIDLRGLQLDRDRPSFFWKGEYSEDFSSRKTLELGLNAFEHFNPLLPEPLTVSRFVLLGNIGPSIQQGVLGQLKGSAFVLTDTMDFWITHNKEELLRVCKQTNLLVINEKEAELLTFKKNVFLAGVDILQLGCEAVIIKRGEYGSVLFHPQGQFILPAFPVIKVVDPTGAGDSYAGALLGFLASIDKTDFSAIKQAMIYATIVASLTVQDFSCNALTSSNLMDIKGNYNHFMRLILAN